MTLAPLGQLDLHNVAGQNLSIIITQVAKIQPGGKARSRFPGRAADHAPEQDQCGVGGQ